MKKLIDFLQEWTWLVFIILFMLIFWGMVFHDIFLMSNSK